MTITNRTTRSFARGEKEGRAILIPPLAKAWGWPVVGRRLRPRALFWRLHSMIGPIRTTAAFSFAIVGSFLGGGILVSMAERGPRAAMAAPAGQPRVIGGSDNEPGIKGWKKGQGWGWIWGKDDE